MCPIFVGSVHMKCDCILNKKYGKMGISNANCVCGNGALEIGGFQILKKDFSLEDVILNNHPIVHLYFFKKCSHFLKKVFSTEKKVISR